MRAALTGILIVCCAAALAGCREETDASTPALDRWVDAATDLPVATTVPSGSVAVGKTIVFDQCPDELESSRPRILRELRFESGTPLELATSWLINQGWERQPTPVTAEFELHHDGFTTGALLYLATDTEVSLSITPLHPDVCR